MILNCNDDFLNTEPQLQVGTFLRQPTSEKVKDDSKVTIRLEDYNNLVDSHNKYIALKEQLTKLLKQLRDSL